MAIHGSCLCGDVAFAFDADPTMMGHCHCSMCRKAHGAAFSTYVGAPAGAFRMLRGADAIGVHESSPGARRAFCPRCGSVVPSAQRGELAFALAGLLDDDPGIRPEVHLFVGSKAPWYDIADDLPRHDAYPPG